MKIKLFVVFLVAISFSNANAQKFELGKVSIAELQEKVHPKDTSAVAAILFEKGKVSFEYDQNVGFLMITEVKTEIRNLERGPVQTPQVSPTKPE